MRVLRSETSQRSIARAYGYRLAGAPTE
jgi:hypothetical protein